nr:FUSC family protein [Agromyces seonyuensis]
MRAGGTRLVTSIPAIVQITVTAVASWSFAHFVLGHQQPLLAGVVAISALGFVGDARPKRVAETVVGMALGIFLAEALLVVAGSGPWQYALALALTLAIARFVSSAPSFTVAAGLQCTLIMLVPAVPGGPFLRTIDAVVGGVFALVATALLPRAPWRTAVRAGRRVIADHLAVWRRLAESVESGSSVDAEAALAAARASDDHVRDWAEAVDSGLAIARVSPFTPRARAELPRQREMQAAFDLATRNLRVIARRTAWLERDGRPVPALADLAGRIVRALELIDAQSLDPENLAAARATLADLVRHLDPARVLPHGTVDELNVAHALRPYLIDLLQATGMPLDDARGLLPEL